MAIIDVFVPQMGEGLTEVRIIEFYKQPGDAVKRDEILYSMETDKATLEVESPQSGTLMEWLASEDQVLPVGAPIARMECSAQAPAQAGPSPAAEPQGIPPRTRAYCRERGLSEVEMRGLRAAGGKLLPSDVDAYLVRRAGAGEAGAAYVDRPLTAQQRALVYRMRRSAQLTIPGTIKRPVKWQPLVEYVGKARAADGPKPTEFQTFAHCAALTVRDFPQFRSTVPTDETVREHAHVNLGVAVARPGGDLVTAVLADADTLDYRTFLTALQERIQAARKGEDQADESTQLLLTYLGSHGVVDAIPVLVAPAVAVIFLGARFRQEGVLQANIVLTFDHRLLNGAEAARFLAALAERIERLAPDKLGA